MKKQCSLFLALTSLVTVLLAGAAAEDLTKLEAPAAAVLINKKADGYRGIWYANQPSQDEYAFTYSGGLGTYTAKHRPLGAYRPQVEKTFFCYGGTTFDDPPRLLHMVSYFDHRRGTVPRPTILLDKQTGDAHDNPVISLDDDGYVWVFSPSHGRARPSYIHRSEMPYTIDVFETIDATRDSQQDKVPLTNFSYPQVWHIARRGFLFFFTRYGDPAARTLMCMTSPNGTTWSEWTRLAAIEKGHYQVTAVGRNRAGTALNYHPQDRGLQGRTNLYYIETGDFGSTWCTVSGMPLQVPLTNVVNPAQVCDYLSDGLNVYLKDICFDAQDRPVILYVTSRGHQSGPRNDPRNWTTAHWTGGAWRIREAFRTDSNYDMGSMWIDQDGTWRIIAPSATGPQPFNPGGEIVIWTSNNQGRTWWQEKQLTSGSQRNHTYVRRPVAAHPDFYAFWADGHARERSLSQLYFADRQWRVWSLPLFMTSANQKPLPFVQAD